MSNTCIILASFGTTNLNGLNAVLNIKRMIEEEFATTPVKITFTSNIIRKVWKKRKANIDEWLNRGVPSEILNVKGIISTVGEAIEEGFEYIILQPTHIFYMEQVHDLFSYVKAFQSIKTLQEKWMPFKKIVMGRPALGMYSEKYSYIDDIKNGIKCLKEDVEIAKRMDADILYMAHGNERFPLGIFYEIEAIFNGIYLDVNTIFACVEGRPTIDEALKKIKSNNVILKPFMIVSGIHVKEDLLKWKEKLEIKGYKVKSIEKGLGENDKFARIFVNHIKDVVNDYSIPL